jgi:hypothetical protein
MEFPQLPRQPIRSQLEPEVADREIYQPEWRCYCCSDTGLVQRVLITLIVPDYDHRHDKPVACQKRGCEAGWNYVTDPNYDQRFTSGICANLDKYQREQWRQTVLTKWEAAKKAQLINQFAAGTNLRKRDRTSEEEELVQRKQEELEADATT